MFRTALRCLKHGEQKILNPYLVKRNRRFLNSINTGEIENRPVFILGPPRCGSTLLYQTMIHCFKFCYFSNEMMRHPYSLPLHVQKHNYPITYSSDFSSKHGATRGLTAPHEGWQFWRRFYPRDKHDYIKSPHYLTESDAGEIVATLNFLSSHYNKPFLTKNIEIGLRLKSIQQILPQAVFIILRRNPVAIASSLLGGRLKTNADKNIWWSTRPAEYEQLRIQPVLNQLAGQITSIYRTIYADIAPHSYIELSYEELCATPSATMEQLQGQLGKKGVKLGETSNVLPDVFKVKQDLLFTESEKIEIENLFQCDDFI